MADMSGIEKAVRVALVGAVTSVTWTSRGTLHQQQQQQQMQGRMDAQRSFATPSAGLGPINQPYGGGMTSSVTSQQVRRHLLFVCHWRKPCGARIVYTPWAIKNVALFVDIFADY